MSRIAVSENRRHITRIGLAATLLMLAVLIGLNITGVGCAKAQSAAPKKPAAAPASAAALPPVYVHMNGFNAFVESVVAVQPGQPVIFVDEDTGAHTIQGYNPATGKPTKLFGMVLGTKGPGHKISTFKAVFKNPGVHYYYCTMHAMLEKVYHHSVQPAHRPTAHGFAGAMAGIVIVTRDPALLAENPTTCKEKILSDYFGG